MSAYTTTAAVEGKVPGPVLTDALDDDGDGRRDEGLLEAIIQNASDGVDALICNRVATPIATPPASVRNAALWFAVEEIYGRRQKELPKDFAKAIASARAWLEAVRAGKQNLDAAVPVVLAAGGGGQPAVPGRVPMSGSAKTYEPDET
jgi:hypothetical protein